MIELEVVSAGPSVRGTESVVYLRERGGPRTIELEVKTAMLREILCGPENRAGRRAAWVSLVAELARLGRVDVKSAVLDAGAGGLVAHIELRGRLETVRVRCPPEDALTLTAGLGVPLYATDAAFGAAAPGAPPREAIPGRVRT